tara:strand:- start:101 stop:1948 length:1848 start_codon:yes stop_codon:yes gene_type:complete
MSIEKNKRPEVSKTGGTKFFKRSAGSVSACQIYRETVKNAFEAVIKMQKIDPSFKGKVIIKEDENLKNKISIHDNGIGMSKNKIADLIINIAETEEESEHGNYGIGSKIAGFANHRWGMIYTSKRYNEDIGSRCRVYFDETDRVGVQHSDEHNSCTVPVEKEDLPSLIKKYDHGTSLILGGNFEKDNTLTPPEDYEKSSLLKSSRMGTQWLKAYFNTKFFKIPKNISFTIEIKKKDGKRFETILGHEAMLKKFCSKNGTLKHPSANIHWWILNGVDKNIKNSNVDCMVNGHLATMLNDEILDIKFDGNNVKNPLRHWGLDFSYKEIAIIIEPIGFEMDHYRNGLVKNKTKIEDFMNIFKEYFMENMPEDIKKYEAELHDKFSKKMEDDSVFEETMRDLLNDFVFKTNIGNEKMKADNLYGGITTTKGNYEGSFFGTEGGTESGIDIKSTYGKDPLFAGLKNKKSKTKGKIGVANVLPKVELTSNQDTWIRYNWDSNTIYIQEDCPVFKIYAEKAYKKNRSKSYELHLFNTKNVVKKTCQCIVSMTRYGDSRLLNLTEEQRRERLIDEQAFIFPLLNVPMMLNEIVNASKNLQRQLNDYEIKKNGIKEKAQLPRIN